MKTIFKGITGLAAAGKDEEFPEIIGVFCGFGVGVVILIALLRIIP